MSAIGGTSSGVHESQSRLWENHVGRSAAFWRLHFPTLQAAFPEALTSDVRTFYGYCSDRMAFASKLFLSTVSCEMIALFECTILQITWQDFHAAINAAEPGLIRVEADELTYDFHIMLRTELEAQLLTGELEVSDVPAAWNAAVKKMLGVDVPDDARGCLQVRKIASRLQVVPSSTYMPERIVLWCAIGYTLVWWVSRIVLQLHHRECCGSSAFRRGGEAVTLNSSAQANTHSFQAPTSVFPSDSSRVAIILVL